MRDQSENQAGRFEQTIPTIFLSFILPIRVIKGAWRNEGLVSAYLIHVLGTVAGLLGLIIFDMLHNRGDGLNDIGYTMGISHGEEMLIGMLLLLVWVTLYAAMFLVLAWVLMPWGGAPESWRRGMRRSLTRVLQLTPFFAFSLVFFVWCLFLLDEARPSYYDYRNAAPSWLSREMVDFLMGLCVLVYGMSQIVVTLWAVTIHEQHPTWAGHCPWPAECEGCGYAIINIAPGSACPECGYATRDTVNSPRSQNDPRSVYKKMFQATFFPHRFGKTIPLYRPTTDYRLALCNSVLALMLTAPVGMTLAFLMFFIYEQQGIESLWREFTNNFGELMIGYALITCWTLFAAVGFGLLSATIWGAYARLFHGRNTLYPAGQAFAYQSGFLVLWVLGFYPLGAGIGIAMEHAYSTYGFGYSRPMPTIYRFVPMVIPIYFVLMATVGFILHGRLLRGAKHGNG